ncbi:hypothetical protein Ddc_01231 [Ditylenchus destructor]|nr:hypothetical protein Ddc_01231 [Ditylenchus destructor]
MSFFCYQKSFVTLIVCIFVCRDCVQTVKTKTIHEIKSAFEGIKNQEHYTKVISFIGLTDGEYADSNGVKAIIKEHLNKYVNEKIIVNAGGRKAGIGVVYELAATMIASSAKDEPKDCNWKLTGIVWEKGANDVVTGVLPFFTDGYWGGYNPEAQKLYPASETMIQVSDEIVAVGGGDIQMIEIAEAERRSKTVVKYMEQPAQRESPSLLSDRVSTLRSGSNDFISLKLLQSGIAIGVKMSQKSGNS